MTQVVTCNWWKTHFEFFVMQLLETINSNKFLHLSLLESKYKLRGFVAERKGERNDMQDAHVINNDFLEEFGADKPLGL